MSASPYVLWRAARESQARRVASNPAKRLTFGRDELYVVEGASDAAGAADERMAAGRSLQQLHLVVQVGNRFQAEHPDVPVLYSNGRYLLVDLSPEEAARRSRSACYAIQPVSLPQVVYEQRARGAGRARARQGVQDVLDLMSPSRLLSSVERLAATQTRESTSDGFREAADGAKMTFEEVGCEVRLQEVAVGAKRSLNVVADRRGSGPPPRGTVMVTAHLDSVNHDNPSGAAPGADDNASGAAGVLEIATCLAAHGHAHDLRFVLFGGEEQGLFGSLAHVASLGSGHGVRAVVNMDMIATVNTATGPTVLIEGGPVSQTLIDDLAAAAETYTGLAVQTSLHFANSDHVPFIRAGIPAVLLIEGNDAANIHVHTARDTVERLNVDLMAEIVRMHLAFLVEAAGVAAV
jgi:hypothetical protein